MVPKGWRVREDCTAVDPGEGNICSPQPSHHNGCLLNDKCCVIITVEVKGLGFFLGGSIVHWCYGRVVDGQIK